MAIPLGGISNAVILGSGSNSGGILDALTGVATSFAVSGRRLRTAYTGSAMRVRRSSDNVEADIGFLGNGDLDTAALLAHVGANSGFVTKFYDQSGNARDLVQATPANQPRIVNAGVIDRLGNATARPAIRTDGVAQFIAGAFTVNTPLTRSSVLQPITVGVGVNRRLVSCPADVPDMTLYVQGAAGDLNSFGGAAGLRVTAAVTSTPATVAEYFTADASAFSTYNGVVGPTGSKGLQASISGVSLSLAAGLSPGDGYFGEVIVFPTALSTSSRQTLEADQRRYYGTP